jgi:hypothetical protein
MNAENIRRCIRYLQETKWDGVVSIECHGSDDNTDASVAFMKSLLPTARRKR